MPQATVPPWSEEHDYEYADLPPSDGLGFGIAALLVEVLVATWFVLDVTGVVTVGAGQWFLMLFVLPLVAVVCAVQALVRGHGRPDPRHRTAFRLGVVATAAAVVGVLVGLALLLAEVLTA